MDAKDAIKILDNLAENFPFSGYTDGAKEACMMGASAMRKLRYLDGRPCEVCSCHNENGCGVWECMFDGKENYENRSD